MPGFLVLLKTASGIELQAVQAADLAAVEALLLQTFGQGLGVNAGVREQIGVGIARLDAIGQIAPNANLASATANWNDSAGWNVLSQAADQVVTNSAVLVASNTLTFAMLANTKYRIRGTIFYDTTATGDMKFTFVGPAIGTGLIRSELIATVAGAAPAFVAVGTAYPAAAGVALAGTGTTGGRIAFEFIVQNGANAGTFAFQFAQNTQTNDTGAIVRAGSYMEYAVA